MTLTQRFDISFTMDDPSQPEALGLYARCGYQACEWFGTYTDDPLSVFMQKVL